LLLNYLCMYRITVIQSTTTSSTPTLTYVINADDRRGVIGVTSVDDRLFVLRSPSEQSIGVYDLKTFTLQQKTLKVSGLVDNSFSGLTSCVINKCLYVSDNVSATVYKVQLSVNNRISMWSVGRTPCGLSINNACNLLVACCCLLDSASKIQEYTTNGSLVREICIQSNDGKWLSPYHVIQLTSGEFVVSCQDVNRGVSDVVELDANGQIVVSYTNQLQTTTQQNFSWPRHLAVDEKSQCILVADCLNNRIVILSRSSNCRSQEFNAMSNDGGLQYPSCLHFDESQGRLFVGEGSHLYGVGCRRVLIFDNVSFSKLSLM
jgi:DNA-binding beta-propeller fold protein YncE